jgi:hypothetical protein
MAKTLAKKFASVARAREIDEQSQSSFKQSYDNAREGWREMDFFRESVFPPFFHPPTVYIQTGRPDCANFRPISGANPTIVTYNANVVKVYRATNSITRF